MSCMTTLAILVVALPLAASFAGVLPGSALLRRALTRPAARTPAPLRMVIWDDIVMPSRATTLSVVASESSESAVSEEITRGRDLASRVAAAATGDTIVLEKGTYWLEKTLVIDKQLTLTSAEGLGYRDVMIQGNAPMRVVESGLIFCTGMKANEAVVIRGVSVYYREGLGVAKTSCIRVEHGSVDVRECHLYADMGAGLSVDGREGYALVQQSRIGPCCWNTNGGRLAYGLVADLGGHLRVYNSEVSHCFKSGIACGAGGITEGFVSGCRIRACGISAIAAEGIATVVEVEKCEFGVCKIDPMAEFGGGKCIFLDDSYTLWKDAYNLANAATPAL